MGLFSIKKNSEIDLSKQINKQKYDIIKSKDFNKEYPHLLKLINSFFSRKYDVHYKFTYEDLKYELIEKIPEKHKEQVSSFFDELNELEFDKQKITKEALITICEKFSEISKISETAENPFEKKIEIPSFSDEMFAPPDLIESKDKKEETFKEKISKEKISEVPLEEITSKKPSEKISSYEMPIPENIETEEEPIIPKEIKPRKKIWKEILKKDPAPIIDYPSEAEKYDDEPIKQDLVEIINKLSRNKTEISKELSLIEKEQQILEKEKKTADSEALPAFKIFNRQKDDEIKELNYKKDILLKKEKAIEEKLKELHDIQARLSDFSENLKLGSKNVKKRHEYIKAKEKVITEIKKDLDKNYKKAMQEIEEIRKDIKIKEEQFLGLQEFFKKRENKLSIEESNLFDEKIKYRKSISNLIDKHLEIARQDLYLVEEKLESIKKKISDAENKIKSYDTRYDELRKRKDEMKAELKQKQEYFQNAEKEFSLKNEDFKKLSEYLDKKENNILKLEKKITEFEKEIEESEKISRKKSQDIEIKELDLKSVERDIRRLIFEIKTQETRVSIKEKQFTKRNSSFERLRKDMKSSISREKREINKIEKRLSSKGSYLNSQLKKLEGFEDFYGKEFDAEQQISSKFHKKAPEDFEEDIDEKSQEDEVTLKEIKVTETFSEGKIGSPDYLDILKLLNKAKTFIRTNQKDRSRDVYLEIQRMFNNMDDMDREELYPEILDVFKTKAGIVSNYSGNSNSNIDMLIQDFENSIILGNMQDSENIYEQLQNMYNYLPEEKKPMYFNKIMTLYNRISVA